MMLMLKTEDAFLSKVIEVSFLSAAQPGHHLLLPAHAHADSSLTRPLPDAVREQQAVRPGAAVRRLRARPAAARAAQRSLRL